MAKETIFSKANGSRRSFLHKLAMVPAGAVAAHYAFGQQVQPPSITTSPTQAPEAGGIYGKRPPIPEVEPFASTIVFSAKQVPSKVKEFDYAAVTLDEGPLKDARTWNRAYMLRLPTERLLHNFRINAGLSSEAMPLGGWEAPTSELRGHFVGHYLSACALHYAATGDKEIKARGDALIEGIAACQERLNDGGYVSAFPATLFTRLDERKPVWAPFYTLHKVMAGLLDMAQHGKNDKALQTLLKLAGWVDTWTAVRSEAHMQEILVVEYGGMNDVFYCLAAVTNDPRWARTGDRFTKKKFFNPLAMRRDELIKLHANTHIPQVLGAATRYELSSDYRFADVANFFFDTVVSTRTYATGGSSNNEVWQTQPNHLSLEMKAATHHQECCCAYNMMKLSRRLYGWSGQVRYIDYYERNLYNHRLGMIQPGTGLTSYFLSLTPGAWKTVCTEDETFWCCTGSALEEYAGINSSIYAHDDDGLYINLFVSSQLNWKERGIEVWQSTMFPEESKTTIIIKASPKGKWPLRIRVPSWTTEEVEIRINNRIVEATAIPGSYLSLRRRWRAGDKVEFKMPMRVVAEPVHDDNRWQAFVYGPIVLAGQFPIGPLSEKLLRRNQGPEVAEAPIEVPTLKSIDGNVVAAIQPVAGKGLQFTVSGQKQPLLLKPISESWDRFSVYWFIEDSA